MKKKILATAIASAMVMPSAFAAQDTSGMRYTSASEGFYASIRVEHRNGNTSTSGSNIQDSWGITRFGVRGTNDLGGGLEGFYLYEAGLQNDNGGGLSTRLSHVGLRGAFGQIQTGTFWTQGYNWIYGSTDVANTGGGNLVQYGSNNAWISSANATRLGFPAVNVIPGRQSRAIEYTSPDLNGFQGAAMVSMIDNPDGGSDDTDIDLYSLTGHYSIAGFSVGGVYSVAPDILNNGTTSFFGASGSPVTEGQMRAVVDGITASDAAADAATTIVTTGGQEDHSLYAVKLGYSQDNWYVNAWYGADNRSDASMQYIRPGGNTMVTEGVGTLSPDDAEMFSIAAGITVGKVALYALHDNIQTGFSYGPTNGDGATGGATAALIDIPAGSQTTEDSYTVFGVQYNLGSRSRVWVDYVARDLESNANADDYVAIGLRHDF